MCHVYLKKTIVYIRCLDMMVPVVTSFGRAVLEPPVPCQATCLWRLAKKITIHRVFTPSFFLGGIFKNPQEWPKISLVMTDIAIENGHRNSEFSY